MRKFFTSLACFALIILGAIGLTGCGNTATKLYNIDFGGNVAGDSYSVAASTWEETQEEGYDAVYTLKGTIAYDKTTADAMGYTDGRVHFVLIKFTSDKVTKVSYNKEDGTGFYNILNKGTENEKVKHQSFTTESPVASKTTYFFYQGIDNTVRTLTMHISFDGTKENEAVYKFVIDPANYTLAPAPAEA